MMRFSRDSTISTPSGCGQRAAGQSGAVAARDKRNLVLMAQPHDLLHFFGACSGSTTQPGVARSRASPSDS